MSQNSQRRIEAIVTAVTAEGRQPIRVVADRFGVSEMTVRRDISAAGGRLAALGGQVVLGSGILPRYALDSEQNSHVSAKMSASRHAAGKIDVEDTIFLDCGSTMAHLAGMIPADHEITVVTYAMNIAAIASQISGVRLVMIGGVYQPASASFSGNEGLTVMDGVRINKAFISAGGVHITLGVSCSNFYETPAKILAIKNAANSYIVADKSKYNRVKPAYFSDLQSFNGFIHEDGFVSATEIATLL